MVIKTDGNLLLKVQKTLVQTIWKLWINQRNRKNKLQIGILFYNKGKVGGAERRYYNLIQEISKSKDVFILTNKSIAAFWQNLGGFNSKVIVSLLDDENSSSPNPTLYISGEKKTTVPQRPVSVKKIIPKRIRAHILQIRETVQLNIKVYKWTRSKRITHINAMQGAAILTVLSKIILNVRVVFSYVDYMVQNGYPFCWIENQGLKTVIRMADRIDFLSEMIPARIEEKGLRLNRNKVCVAPVSFTDYSRFTIKTPKKRVVVFSGRFEDIKNPILAIETARELVSRKIDFQMKIIGYGSLTDKMLDLVRKWDLEKYVRIFATDKIEDELADAAVFLSLQRENNYPSQALLEAMACGCIPIVTDVGETRKIVNEENGFLVEGKAAEIADIINVVFDNLSLYERKGEKNRENTLKIFSAEGYLEYFKSLINDKT